MARRDCPRCEGCGFIADTEKGEPWKHWMNLPPGSDLSVRLGLVKPILCPECGGPENKPQKVTCNRTLLGLPDEEKT